MNILLDTHVLIWALENNPTLSKEAANCIVDGRNMVFASAASAWEIGIKMAAGKLEAPDNLLEEIRMHRFIPLWILFRFPQKPRRSRLPGAGLRGRDT